MNVTRSLRHLTCLSLLMLVAALAVAATASAAAGGLPHAFGKLCGNVAGASWKFQGQTGSHYNVAALGAGSCGVAMKSVPALTRQKAHASGPQIQMLVAPSGFRCATSGIPLAHAGFCAGGAVHFNWAPLLKR
jgi:hypothetical protein